MGLDINFYWVKREALERTDKEYNPKTDEGYHWGSDEQSYSKEAYFRKYNFLLPFFGYEDNCSDMPILKSQIRQLAEACRAVLKERNPQYSNDWLPTVEGFFFGSTDYNDNYYEKVEAVKKWAEELSVREWDKDMVLILHRWW